MATFSGGTVATTSLTGMTFLMSDYADIATIAALIKNDQNVAHPVIPHSFTQEGLLFVPNRGVLKVLPSDVVFVDASGWPILVSANSIADVSTSWNT